MLNEVCECLAFLNPQSARTMEFVIDNCSTASSRSAFHHLTLHITNYVRPAG